jgi:hypothetical protein
MLKNESTTGVERLIVTNGRRRCRSRPALSPRPARPDRRAYAPRWEQTIAERDGTATRRGARDRVSLGQPRPAIAPAQIRNVSSKSRPSDGTVAASSLRRSGHERPVPDITHFATRPGVYTFF